MIVQNNSADEL